MMFEISTILQRQILDIIRDSRFLGMMIDECTEISLLAHLVIFTIFLEGGVVTTSFLDLLWIVDGQKSPSVIFDLFIGVLKTWGLDMNKCIGFKFDGGSTMVGKNTCVATLLKNVNIFLTSIYCVAHSYTKLQHAHYKTILNSHFTHTQNRDTRSIPPPTTVPLTQIFINECNPEKNILTNKNII